MIYSTTDEVFKSFQQDSGPWRSLGKEYNLSWHDIKTRGCHLKNEVLAAGAAENGSCEKVQLLNILDKGSVKDLPNLLYGSACAGMAWDRADNSVVLAGGDQRKEGTWHVTDQMFILPNVGEEGSDQWKELPCKLPCAMADPEMLMSDSHLYLLGCDPTGKRAHRIPKNKLKPNSEDCVWEELESLKYAIDSNSAKRGTVFIQNKVVVFTLYNIMVLNLEVSPLSWKYISIVNKDVNKCIPRFLNDDSILVLMEREFQHGRIEKVLEKYYPETNQWEDLVPTARKDDEVGQANLIPWQFFVIHIKFNIDDRLLACME